jgi:hypothetical protein
VRPRDRHTDGYVFRTPDGGVDMGLTIYGVTVLTFMMVMYALERRHDFYIAAFALGCALSSSYGFLSGAWPFGVIEAIWCVIAARRYLLTRRPPRSASNPATNERP